MFLEKCVTCLLKIAASDSPNHTFTVMNKKYEMSSVKSDVNKTLRPLTLGKEKNIQR